MDRQSIYVLPKHRFDAIAIARGFNDKNVSSQDVYFISINDTHDDASKPYFTPHSNVMILYLDDLEKDLEIPLIGTNKKDIYKAMTYEQALDLFDFIKSNIDKKTCLVHCHAGVSRSGAVGLFINEYLGQNEERFRVLHPNIAPNPHILSLLRKARKQREEESKVRYLLISLILLLTITTAIFAPLNSDAIIRLVVGAIFSLIIYAIGVFIKSFA